MDGMNAVGLGILTHTIGMMIGWRVGMSWRARERDQLCERLVMEAYDEYRRITGESHRNDPRKLEVIKEKRKRRGPFTES